jgi:hypothetical protein
MSDEQSNEVEAGAVEEVKTEAVKAPAEVSAEKTPAELQVEKDQRTSESFAKLATKGAKARKGQEAAELENTQLKEKLAKFETKGPVEVPPMPDQYADEAVYNQTMRERDAALTYNAEIAAQSRFTQSQQEQEQRGRQEKAQQRAQEQFNGHVAKAKEVGLTADELRTTGQAIIDAGASDDLVSLILDDDDGPLIQKYLAANPLVLDEVANLSPAQMGIMVERKIRPAANALKQKPSTTPDPAETLNGRGAPEGKDPWLAGGTYS